MPEEKLPPHDVDAEEAVVGSLLLDGESIYKVSSFLRSQDFFREKNAWLYEACLSLYQRNEAINQVTVAQELSRKEKLDAAGGPAYLIHVLSAVPTSLHIEHYGQIVYRLSVMRQLISSAGQIAAIGYESPPDVDDALNKAEDILFRLRHGQSPRDFIHIRQALDHYLEESAPETVTEPGEPVKQLLTGFAQLDEFLGGLQRSDLIILGARPSMGKTSLALSIALNAARKRGRASLDGQGATIALFSLEMAREALIQRFLAVETGIDMKRVRLAQHTELEQERIVNATGELSELNIFIDDSPLLRPVEMRSKARRLHFEHPIDLVIVDYLQLIQGTGRGDNRVQEISEISRSLKALARELHVPVLAASQLSRAVEWRASHRPQLADLRESGSIEQDADIVMFIHREDYYYRTEEDWFKDHPDDPYPAGRADVIVAKHRNGPTGDVPLRFIPSTAEFRDWDLAPNSFS
ncbi:MAG: replicative DNA helicase [Chloroflexi bacterium]|nr:replicative DNA helicase [Chloroflexota bacterium]